MVIVSSASPSKGKTAFGICRQSIALPQGCVQQGCWTQVYKGKTEPAEVPVALPPVARARRGWRAPVLQATQDCRAMQVFTTSLEARQLTATPAETMTMARKRIPGKTAYYGSRPFSLRPVGPLAPPFDINGASPTRRRLALATSSCTASRQGNSTRVNGVANRIP